jgi:hypothetical protein
MDDKLPEIPVHELNAAVGDHPEALAAIEAFHAEYTSDAPDPKKLDEHATQLRGFGELVAPFERWYLNPRVQAFISELNATGL